MKKQIKKYLKKLLRIEKPNVVSKTLLDRLKENGLKVGDDFNMLPECIIDYSHCWHIEIGNNVTLAPRVHILAHDASTKIFLNYTKVKNVKIGNNVFIGTSTIIMPGVVIGDNVIVGAGSVVTKSIPDNSIFVGNPAKFICHTGLYLEKIKEKMNENNVFGEAFTLRNDISFEKKIEMINAVKLNDVAFVI
jgi:maltose O-acetyltransferase